MTTLTTLQTKILTAAAAAEDGAIAMPENAKKPIAAMIKRGWLISLPQGDGPSRLLVTAEGRAAVAAPTPEDKPADGVDVEHAVSPTVEPTAEIAEAEDQTQSAKDPEPTRALRGKLGMVVAMLRKPQGATIEAMMAATGWQAHSVRGVMAGAIKKRLGLAITSDKVDDVRVYRIVEEAAA